VFKCFVPIRSSAPIQLWLGNNPQATGGITQYGGQSMVEPEGSKTTPEFESMQIYETAAKDFIYHNPKRFLFLRAKSFIFFWITSRPWLGGGQKIDILNVADALFVILTSFPGIVIAFRRDRRRTLIWLLFFATYVSVFTLTCADSTDRYRMPIDPFLLGFSAVFLNEWLSNKQQDHETLA
jgi:hypothetical protein